MSSVWLALGSVVCVFVVVMAPIWVALVGEGKGDGPTVPVEW